MWSGNLLHVYQFDWPFTPVHLQIPLIFSSISVKGFITCGSPVTDVIQYLFQRGTGHSCSNMTQPIQSNWKKNLQQCDLFLFYIKVWFQAMKPKTLVSISGQNLKCQFKKTDNCVNTLHVLYLIQWCMVITSCFILFIMISMLYILSSRSTPDLLHF